MRSGTRSSSVDEQLRPTPFHPKKTCSSEARSAKDPGRLWPVGRSPKCNLDFFCEVPTPTFGFGTVVI